MTIAVGCTVSGALGYQGHYLYGTCYDKERTNDVNGKVILLLALVVANEMPILMAYSGGVMLF
jgi:hypothetical protein